MKFRFTIRDWIWLVLVLALSIIWLLDRSRLSGEIAGLKEEIGQLQMDVLHATGANLSETMNTMIRGYMDPSQRSGEVQSTNDPPGKP